MTRALVFVALLGAAACQPQRSPQNGQATQNQDPKAPVARISGQTITAGELDESVKKDLAQLEQRFQEQRYQLRRQALESMLRRRAFDAKAKSKGMSTEELVNKEVGAKVADPSDDEVRALYERAKAGGQKLPPFEQVKADIVRFIKSQKGQGAMAEYYEQLKKEQNIEVLLPPYEPPKVAVDATGPSRGSASAKVTIVEFSDYECPFCVKAEGTVKEILAAYPEKIRLVYRDFPLPMHSKAPKAAEAAQCASDQGKFWDMHDRLFAANGKLEISDLKAYAREIGIDGSKFDSCLESGGKAKMVEANRKAGEEAGVTGTPAFFINGRPISGAQPADAFKTIIDQELAKK